MKSKIIVLFLLSVQFMFSSQLQNLPDNFIKTFNIYQKYNIQRDIEKMYKFEIAYSKYLHDINDFTELVNRYKKPIEISIAEVSSVSDDHIAIVIQQKFGKNEKDIAYLNQNWYNIKGEYFILSNYKIIPD